MEGPEGHAVEFGLDLEVLDDFEQYNQSLNLTDVGSTDCVRRNQSEGVSLEL